jgi:hypothetical protein
MEVLADESCDDAKDASRHKPCFGNATLCCAVETMMDSDAGEKYRQCCDQCNGGSCYKCDCLSILTDSIREYKIVIVNMDIGVMN